MHNKDRSHYQYALLNMAILQADFGCFDEAIAAMNETIAMARENKDMDCLNFSLSWLYHFRTAYIGGRKASVGGLMVGSDQQNLKFLKAEAKDRKMWNILSSTLLNEAKLCLSRVPSQPYHSTRLVLLTINTQGLSTREAFEHVYESSHLNVQHNIISVEIPQLLVRSSMFGRLGVFLEPNAAT